MSKGSCYRCKHAISNHGSNHNAFPYVHISVMQTLTIAFLISKEQKEAFDRFGCGSFEPKGEGKVEK